MENKSNQLSQEQTEIMKMITEVCPPVVNTVLKKANIFRRALKSTTETLQHFCDLTGTPVKK